MISFDKLKPKPNFLSPVPSVLRPVQELLKNILTMDSKLNIELK